MLLSNIKQRVLIDDENLYNTDDADSLTMWSKSNENILFCMNQDCPLAAYPLYKGCPCTSLRYNKRCVVFLSRPNRSREDAQPKAKK